MPKCFPTRADQAAKEFQGTAILYC